MLGPPLLDPFHIVRPAEVIAILRPAQPTPLIGLLSERLTFRTRTVLLPSAVAVIGDEQLLAVQAFAANGCGLHQVENPPR